MKQSIGNGGSSIGSILSPPRGSGTGNSPSGSSMRAGASISRWERAMNERRRRGPGAFIGRSSTKDGPAPMRIFPASCRWRCVGRPTRWCGLTPRSTRARAAARSSQRLTRLAGHRKKAIHRALMRESAFACGVPTAGGHRCDITFAGAAEAVQEIRRRGSCLHEPRCFGQRAWLD
jgi:hypothetical protein